MGAAGALTTLAPPVGVTEPPAALAAAGVLLPATPPAAAVWEPPPSAALLEVEACSSPASCGDIPAGRGSAAAAGVLGKAPQEAQPVELAAFAATDPPAALVTGGVAEPPAEPMATLLLFDGARASSGCDDVLSRGSADPASKREHTDCIMCSKLRTRPISSKMCLSCSSSRNSIIFALLSGTSCSRACFNTFSIARPLALRVEVASAFALTSSMKAAKPSLLFEAAAASPEPAGAAKELLCVPSPDVRDLALEPGLGVLPRRRGDVEPDIDSGVMGRRQLRA
mmetsp:Transcript_61681/g.116693  ORF Transcript_61681/g.116693 Transcript_61681/m.116693 type:complete len:283 (-) Transcript_61681:28-876(-)